MSSSPTSPSNRKRQPAGAATQPQAIAPAPSLPTQSTTTAPAAPLAAASGPPAASVPTPINVPAAKKVVEPEAGPLQSPSSSRKRKAGEMAADPSKEAVRAAVGLPSTVAGKSGSDAVAPEPSTAVENVPVQPTPPAKKSRTNTPWTPAEERKLKTLRDAGSSWGEIAKEFPHRTEGSVKKHWYKDMHYADFAEDESAALLAAIREYEANKWKEIGKKVGKPAKACEQYAKEHFSGKL